MTPEDLKSLSKLIGYGEEQPTLAFIGIEEAGGGEENITARRRYQTPLMDMQRAHEILSQYARIDDPYARQHRPVRVWMTAARFAIEFFDLHRSHTADGYWRTKLGRPGSGTLMTECYPVPRGSISKKVAGYTPKEVWERYRKQELERFFRSNRPKYLVAYGKTTYDPVNQLFPVNAWTAIEFEGKDIGSTGVDANGTVICRTGFFGRGFNRTYIPRVVAAMRRASTGHNP